MKRKTVLMAVVLLLAAAIVAQAETVEEKEKRLVDLKQQVAKLEAEIAAAKGGAGAKSGGTMEAKLAEMPKELFPTDGEIAVKRDMRNDWVDKNTRGVFGPWTFTGKIEHMDVVTRQVENPVPGGPETKKMINVSLVCAEGAEVWGCKIAAVKVDVCLDYEVAAQSLAWKTDGSTTISVSGKAEFTSVPAMNGDTIGVKIEQGTLEK